LSFLRPLWRGRTGRGNTGGIAEWGASIGLAVSRAGPAGTDPHPVRAGPDGIRCFDGPFGRSGVRRAVEIVAGGARSIGRIARRAARETRGRRRGAAAVVGRYTGRDTDRSHLVVRGRGRGMGVVACSLAVVAGSGVSAGGTRCARAWRAGGPAGGGIAASG